MPGARSATSEKNYNWRSTHEGRVNQCEGTYSSARSNLPPSSSLTIPSSYRGQSVAIVHKMMKREIQKIRFRCLSLSKMISAPVTTGIIFSWMQLECAKVEQIALQSKSLRTKRRKQTNYARTDCSRNDVSATNLF